MRSFSFFVVCLLFPLFCQADNGSRPTTEIKKVRIAKKYQTPLARDEEYSRQHRKMDERFARRAWGKRPPKAANPSHRQFPGTTPEGAPRLDCALTLSGETPAFLPGDETALRTTLRPTGLYAVAGEWLDIFIPENLVDSGLQIQIGIHPHRPQTLARQKLTQPRTHVSSAYGGLVFLCIPPKFPAPEVSLRITGALDTPFFVCGKTSLESWQQRRQAPGAWGYLETKSLILALPRKCLASVERPDLLLDYWQECMDQLDLFSARGKGRKRPEVLALDRSRASSATTRYPRIVADAAPFLSPQVRQQGSWKATRALGQTTRTAFLSAFSFSGGGIEDNLFPFYFYEMRHQPKDEIKVYPNPSVSPFHILPAREEWLKQVERGQQEWNGTQGNIAQAQFFWQLKDAFGWDLFLQINEKLCKHAQKYGIERLSFSQRRDLWLACAEETSGYNLHPYFERWGHRNLPPQNTTGKTAPSWSGNRAPEPIRGTTLHLRVAENCPEGKLISTFSSRDPDPANIVHYRIVDGERRENFLLDPETGKLSVRRLDYEKDARHVLTIAAIDNATPAKTSTCNITIEVENVSEPPIVHAQNFYLRPSLQSGDAVGQVRATADMGKRLQFRLVPGSAFAIDADSGKLRVCHPERLSPNGRDQAKVEVSHLGQPKEKTTAELHIYSRLQNGLFREVWLRPTPLPTSTPPDRCDTLRQFGTAMAGAQGYSERFETLLFPPETGKYLFSTRAAGLVEIWLSDEVSGRRGRFLFGPAVAGETQGKNWRGVPLSLRKDRVYRLEVLHRQPAGAMEDFSLSWKKDRLAEQHLDGTCLFLPPCSGK